MPVRNEAPYLPATLDALMAALDRSAFAAEIVVVDDGSTDGSAGVATSAVAGRLPLRIISQPNRGRFEARRAGVSASGAEWVLLVDGRVRVRPDALAYVRERLAAGRRVWTAHVNVNARGNPYGEFWQLLAELAWDEYFGDPRDTSFGLQDFDRFPKGTTCFFAPRALLAEAIASFHSRFSDARHVNDDTPLIRWLAERERINVSPGFACDYEPRTSLVSFLRHSFHRGVVFLDGHGRPESAYFPAVVAFYPLSAACVVAALRRPRAAPLLAAATGLAAAGAGALRGRSASEIRALGLLAPLYACAHGAGMWRGLALLKGRSRE
jgi:glycosyltransferase involved in cell wall biosynthesis